MTGPLKHNRVVEQSIYKVRFYKTQLLLNNKMYVKGQHEIVYLSDSVLEENRAVSRGRQREEKEQGGVYTFWASQ